MKPRWQNTAAVASSILLAAVTAAMMAQIRIQHVAVHGQAEIPVERIVEAIDPWLAVPVLSVPVGDLADALQERFALRNVRVEVQWPDTLRVDIEERRTAMWLLEEDGVYGMDVEGYRLLRADTDVQAGTIPVLVAGCAGGRDRVTECTAAAARLFRHLQVSKLDMTQLSTIAMEPKGPELWLEGPVHVRLGNTERIAEKMDMLQRALQWMTRKGHTVRRIDLENLEHPVVKLDQPVA